MSKKTKRQSRRTSASTSSVVQESVAAPARSSAASYEKEFNPDYSQTIKDLRRIGILAGSFFTVLVILSFFLR